MKIFPLLLLVVTLSACAASRPIDSDVAAQDRLVQPGPATNQSYWDALNAVPGSRTGEADYYYAHRGRR